MLWNTLKDGLCYLQNESLSMKFFLLNMHETTDFTWSGQAYTSFNLLRILNFFYENYWPRLTSSSKCKGSVSHGDIKFWFSGNANPGRHCLLLQFHLTYQIRCIMNFKKITDTSFNECNNTYQRIIRLRTVDVKSTTNIDFDVESNEKESKFEVVDHVKISKYKNFFAIFTPQLDLKKFLWLKKLKLPRRGHMPLVISRLKKLLESLMRK